MRNTTQINDAHPTLTGTRIVLDQKKNRIVVEGNGKNPAIVEQTAAGMTGKQQAKKIILDLTTGTMKVVDF